MMGFDRTQRLPLTVILPAINLHLEAIKSQRDLYSLKTLCSEKSEKNETDNKPYQFQIQTAKTLPTSRNN